MTVVLDIFKNQERNYPPGPQFRGTDGLGGAQGDMDNGQQCPHRKIDIFGPASVYHSLNTLSTFRPECQRCLFPFLLVDGSLHCLVTIQRYIHPDETMFEVVTMLDDCDNDHDENAQD